MKNKLITWTLVSLVASAVYLLATYKPSGYGAFFNFGMMLGPIIFTLVAPLLIGAVVAGISSLFTKSVSAIFSAAVWVVQVICIIFLLISIYGQL
ncbi:MAG: hypothetical protein ACK5LR_02420 [Mangrovibacterium sp.]